MSAVQNHGFIGEDEALNNLYGSHILSLAKPQFKNNQHDDFPEIILYIFNINDEIIIPEYIFSTSLILVGMDNSKEIVFSDFIVLPENNKKGEYISKKITATISELYSLIDRELVLKNRLLYLKIEDAYNYIRTLFKKTNRIVDNIFYFPRSSVKLSSTTTIDNADARAFYFDNRELNLILAFHKQEGDFKRIKKSKIIYLSEENILDMKGCVDYNQVNTLQVKLEKIYKSYDFIINEKMKKIYKKSQFEAVKYRKNKSNYALLRKIGGGVVSIASKIDSKGQNRMQNTINFKKLFLLLNLDLNFKNELNLTDIYSKKRVLSKKLSKV